MVIDGYDPAGTIEQLVAAAIALYRPAEHNVQVEAEIAPKAVEYRPALQEAHTALPAELYCPAVHIVHASLPTEEYIPAGHTVHTELPTEEFVPAGHGVHPEAPASASCVTGPVADHAVEASMGPSYTEW